MRSRIQAPRSPHLQAARPVHPRGCFIILRRFLDPAQVRASPRDHPANVGARGAQGQQRPHQQVERDRGIGRLHFRHPGLARSKSARHLRLSPAMRHAQFSQIERQRQLELDERLFFGRRLEEVPRVTHASPSALETVLLGLFHDDHPAGLRGTDRTANRPLASGRWPRNGHESPRRGRASSLRQISSPLRGTSTSRPKHSCGGSSTSVLDSTTIKFAPS